MRIAIVTDSNSGITQGMARELGIWVVPMPFMVEGEFFEEEINFTQEEFYSRLEEDSDISTSQPSPEGVMKLWEELLETHDEVVHIPMSAALSGSCQTALVLSEDYEGRVQVVNNLRVSVTQKQAVYDALTLVGQGLSAVEIREVLEQTRLDASIYVTVDTLKYLKKGGRITPAAAALGALLKIKPVLQIHGEKLDAFSKARTMKQAKSTMIAAIAHDLEVRFEDPEAKNSRLHVAYSCGAEAAQELVEELRQIYPQHDIIADRLPLSLVCHTGPGALAIACTKNIDLEAYGHGE